jgi:hypothetical protein
LGTLLNFGKFRVLLTWAVLLSLKTTTGDDAYARMRLLRLPLAE